MGKGEMVKDERPRVKGEIKGKGARRCCTDVKVENDNVQTTTTMGSHDTECSSWQDSQAIAATLYSQHHRTSGQHWRHLANGIDEKTKTCPYRNVNLVEMFTLSSVTIIAVRLAGAVTHPRIPGLFGG